MPEYFSIMTIEEAPEDVLQQFANIAEVSFNQGLRLHASINEDNPYLLMVYLISKVGAVATDMVTIASSIENDNEADEEALQNIQENLYQLIAATMMVASKLGVGKNEQNN